MLACLSAAGENGPLLVIFKGKRLLDEWWFGAPINTHVRIFDNGWINSEVFFWTRESIL